MIIIPHGAKKQIMADTGCCQATVRKALHYEIDTETARMIRDRALKFYRGRIV